MAASTWPAGSRPRRGWSWRKSASNSTCAASRAMPRKSRRRSRCCCWCIPSSYPSRRYTPSTSSSCAGQAAGVRRPFSEADSGSDFAATLDGDKSSDLAPLFEAGAAPAAGQGARRRRLCDVHQSWPGPASGPASGLAQLAARGAGPGRHRHCRPGKPDPGDARHPRKAPRSEHQLHALLQSSAQAMPFDASRFGLLRDPGDLMRELRPSGRRHTRRPYPGAGEECLRGGHRGASRRPEGGAQHQCHRRGRYRPAQRSHVGPGAGLLRPARAAALPTTARWWSTRWTTCRAPTR